jgi:primosomal protein N''
LGSGDAHMVVRLEGEMDRRERRASVPLAVRLHRALTTARLLSSAGAARLDRETARAQPGSSPPPPDNSLYEHYERRMRLMVEALEREIDDTQHRPISADMVKESMEQRERRLTRDFEGIHSLEVSFIDRSFGSQRSVERARVKLGRRPVDGVMHEVSQE